jgi:CelD/BcsL family acetyltransferase involved in cellulose biosynthesis
MQQIDKFTPSLDARPGAQDIHSSSHCVQVRRLNTWEDLERWRPEWEQLLLDSSSASIFWTPEWLGAWWRAFGNGRETACMLFLGRNDEVVGLAGFYFEWIRTFVRTRQLCLRFVGDGTYDSVRLDLIIKRGHEKACAEAFVDWLASERGWDICELNTLPADSAVLPHLLCTLSSRRWQHRTLMTPCCAIALPESWEKYLSQISKKERSKINRRTKEIGNQYRVSFNRCTKEADLPVALDVLFELHQKRWKQRGLPGSFSSAERRAFYQEIALSSLKRGWLEFWQIIVDGKPVASHFGFRYGNAVYVLQKGFDPEYMADSVGYVLEAHVIQALIREGVRRYDYLGGGEVSKQRMGAQSDHYVNLHIARPFTTGAFFLRIDQALSSAETWLKANLPPGLQEKVKGAYRAVPRLTNSISEEKPGKAAGGE